ncbi:MAG TPA: transcriptional regulator [Clostridium sp.]|uniref:Helix-turn-helix domain-containing protein n=1 Tax=Clostridium lapidicellarium TaxID=3240931 RepID=A0ABV4DS52_9CLOT|nr:helix-turn-helix domain-containing protein [uncultured Clostridium sp.]NLU08840.1 helix-turn-helix domain-containing protein [Clostridiales bacterium]HBC97789.1 transcriptional regulator [Clostridium sp.]
MDRLQIGEIISKLRKERQITQEQLGKYIGVSTAAVSKWEMGNSYPDIELLPELASFFGVSIDRLLNYRIQLSGEEVMDIFKKCEALLTGEDMEKGVELGKKYIEKYSSSYFLKFRIGFLYDMYSWRSKNKAEADKVEDYAKKLFEDIEKNCSDKNIIEQALYVLSSIYSSRGQDERAVEVLKKINKSEYQVDFMLANIYLKKKDTLNKGRKILQGQLWKDIFYMSFILMCLAKSYCEDKNNLELAERYLNTAIDIKRVFSPEAEAVLGLHIEYMDFANMYSKMGENEKALGMLEKWVEYIEMNNLNEKKRISSVWCFDELSGNRSGFTLDMYENMSKLLEDDIFDPVREDDRFRQISDKVNKIKKHK